jgi:chemotaxis protein methyltransferase CheR
MRELEIIPRPDVRLNAAEFDDFRRLASTNFGLDLKPGKERLVEARLGKLIRAGGFGSYGALYRHIVADSTGRSLSALANALTTNHTAFLRESAHFDFLRDSIAPSLKARGRLDLWCAASATGEEVWTLACVLNGAVRIPIHIDATDISTRALAVAQRGVYDAERCSVLPAKWLSQCFERESGPPSGYRVNERLRAQVTFSRLNLIEPFPTQRKYPVIFCRNVMIYFDAATQQRVTSRLTECLEPGGYLFLGHAESLSRFPTSLEYVRPAVYRKPQGREGHWNKSW